MESVHPYKWPEIYIVFFVVVRLFHLTSLIGVISPYLQLGKGGYQREKVGILGIVLQPCIPPCT